MGDSSTFLSLVAVLFGDFDRDLDVLQRLSSDLKETALSLERERDFERDSERDLEGDLDLRFRFLFFFLSLDLDLECFLCLCFRRRFPLEESSYFLPTFEEEHTPSPR